MHIDEALLERVIESHGFSSKTEAVEMALREMDRKARFRAMVRKGLGLTPTELAEAVDPAYDVHAFRFVETPGKAPGKAPGKYGKRKSRKRIGG